MNEPTAAETYVTFGVADQHFAIPVRAVREILGKQPIRPLPQAPDTIRGIVEVRGQILPVVDLRRRLQVATDEFRGRTEAVLVVVHGHHAVGLQVDAVHEVITIDDHQIAPRPEFDASIDLGFIAGIHRHRDSLLVLLHVQHVLANVAQHIADLSEPVGVAAELSLT